MNGIDTYIHAATSENTRRSYRSAIEHYESQWGGFLPATSDSISKYIAQYADTLSVNTLRQRLAAIAQWHIDQGFPDPTKSPIVKKVFKGIQVLHPARIIQAKPLTLIHLEQINHHLEKQMAKAKAELDKVLLLQSARDRALVLLGFWRGFRSDELSRLNVQNITLVTNEGMVLYLPYTKTNKQGATYRVPALKYLCPVNACQDWFALAKLSSGPAFRSINRWGQIAQREMNSVSLIPLLRRIMENAGIEESESYSSHSLRRGFASWANSSGWDLKTMMEYIGWKDVRTAMSYIEAADPFSKSLINSALTSPEKISSHTI
jgi:site-specific recombinase XerD